MTDQKDYNKTKPPGSKYRSSSKASNQLRFCTPMNGENRLLVTDEQVEFEN